ncbi:MAG: dienelactone hydrolase family protein [Methylibium sp.]|uniref:dienelactone hydrolase family protein n=1 Tax=Methylibium sp. TaxID=2067992 RepID=UPI0018501D09|nr:dienelactone hydrolase family protein [Methylibium sp.]MBA3596013.1 dienelactone hydrolase family protein [Methylibium sp.]
MLQEEFDSLHPTRDLSRRDFVATAVGSGFAAAVLPVAAQTVATDTQGLIAGPVTIPVGDFRMPAYRAVPSATMAGTDGAPVVLVISEVFGVHEHIADVARRLAKQGYLAIAPELFARQGDARAYTDIPTLIKEVVSKKPDAQTMEDLNASVAWAASNGGDTGRLGITGFCWGGRITWLYTAHNPRVKAGVAWYGRLVGEATALAPRHPVDVAGKLHAPVLGLYGGQDGGIPLDTIDKMKSVLAAGNEAARESEFSIYPDAPHAFHADYRPSYRKEAAENGWKRCLAWLEAHGV